jgi:F-type H+-transporting ATPase subunit b
MSLDWFTVAAQLINFLILVGLLRKYLYRPVLKAVDEREKKIAAQLNTAAATEKAAQAEKMAYAEKQVDLDRRAGRLMEQAKTDAEAAHDRLIAEARQSVERQRAQWQAALLTEQEHAGAELTREVQGAVTSVARKFLGDLAGADLEARMTAVFARRLRELGEDQLGKLAGATAGATEITIRSSVPMDEAEKATIREAVGGVIGPTRLGFGFETDKAMVCGIGLYVPGYKLEWSVAGYLEQLNNKISGDGQATPIKTEADGSS